MRTWQSLLILLLVLAQSGCETVRYLTQQSVGQLHLLRIRRPATAVIDDPSTPPLIKQRLRLALQARAFGVSQLGLRGDGEFTRYVDTDGPVAWNLSAAYQTELRLRTYSFPLVGRVAYLGYFSKADALAEVARLQAAGFDTHLRPVGAYSTLGYLLSPIYADMINNPGPRGDYETVETILHEMAHTTAYVLGDSTLNESFATVVGSRGAALFFRQQPADTTPALSAVPVGTATLEPQERARKELQRDQEMSLWLQRTMTRLRQFYADPATRALPRPELLRRREELFALACADYRQTFPERAASRLGRGPLNNALLLSLEVYYGAQARQKGGDSGSPSKPSKPSFSQLDLLQSVDGDLPEYINLYRRAAARSDGAAWLRRVAADEHAAAAAGTATVSD